MTNTRRSRRSNLGIASQRCRTIISSGRSEPWVRDTRTRNVNILNYKKSSQEMKCRISLLTILLPNALRVFYNKHVVNRDPFFVTWGQSIVVELWSGDNWGREWDEAMNDYLPVSNSSSGWGDGRYRLDDGPFDAWPSPRTPAATTTAGMCPMVRVQVWSCCLALGLWTE